VEILMQANLILTGFMGTGKTSVGRAVAERLGRSFVDIDDWIAERAGKPVKAIFDEDGEERFRAWEVEACIELSDPHGQVIATGGWTLGPEPNRQALQRGGRVICLRADPETILARLDGARDRPLLAGDGRAARVRALLDEREPVYASFAWQVDTTRLNVAEAARAVLDLWSAVHALDEPEALWLPMSAATHSLGTSILIGAGLVDALGSLLRARGLCGRAALVADSNLERLHGERMARSLSSAGFEPARLSVSAGEANKSLDSARALYEAFAAAGIERGDFVVAFGGGVIGDLAGFVAATYMRGLRWVCAPTSVLAMVDASVGGKVGVDLPAGKNLVGAFHPPLLTLSDLDLLKTLPEAEFRSGLAEVIKAGLIADAELFGLFEAGRYDVREVVARALRVKVDIVRTDPFEAGRRAALNLGHTIGHGIEAASNYAIRHGEAVAIGLIAESWIAEQLGLAAAGLSRRVEAVISRIGLPTRCPDLDPEAIGAKMRADKKKQAGRLKFALPRGVGEVAIGIDVPDEVVRAALSKCLGTA
jgi:3-dehydroquinate synthase